MIVIEGLICVMRMIATAIITRPTMTSLIMMTNIGISSTSDLKRLTASPGESGNCDAPGRRKIYFKRFLRSKVGISAKMGTSA